MKRSGSFVFALGVGLGLVFILVVVVWGMSPAGTNPTAFDVSSTGSIAGLFAPATWEERGSVAALDFTPVATLYLPLAERGCQPLYMDDFSNPKSGWPDEGTASYGYRYVGGEYRIYADAGWWAGARPGYSASNYVLSVDVRSVGGSDSTYGLIFGQGNWSEFYSLEIDANSGFYGIYRYDPDDEYVVLASGSSGSINSGTAVNRLKIERDGVTIRAYINGSLVETVSDGTYLGSRYVGLIAWGYSTGVDARFDNFVVYDVSCGPTVGAASVTTAAGLLEDPAVGLGHGRWRKERTFR